MPRVLEFGGVHGLRSTKYDANYAAVTAVLTTRGLPGVRGSFCVEAGPTLLSPLPAVVIRFLSLADFRTPPVTAAAIYGTWGQEAFPFVLVDCRPERAAGSVYELTTAERDAVREFVDGVIATLKEQYALLSEKDRFDHPGFYTAVCSEPKQPD